MEKTASSKQQELVMLRAYADSEQEWYLVTDLLEDTFYLVTRNNGQYQLLFPHNGDVVKMNIGLESDITQVAQSVAEHLRSKGRRSPKGIASLHPSLEKSLN